MKEKIFPSQEINYEGHGSKIKTEVLHISSCEYNKAVLEVNRGAKINRNILNLFHNTYRLSIYIENVCMINISLLRELQKRTVKDFDLENCAGNTARETKNHRMGGEGRGSLEVSWSNHLGQNCLTQLLKISKEEILQPLWVTCASALSSTQITDLKSFIRWSLVLLMALVHF